METLEDAKAKRREATKINSLNYRKRRKQLEENLSSSLQAANENIIKLELENTLLKAKVSELSLLNQQLLAQQSNTSTHTSILDDFDFYKFMDVEDIFYQNALHRVVIPDIQVCQ